MAKKRLKPVEMPDPTADLVEKIVHAAERHGLESEPDHEVGDLQDALREAWKRMTPEARSDTITALELWGDNDDEEEV